MTGGKCAKNPVPVTSSHQKTITACIITPKGKRHREDGPAVVHLTENGRVSTAVCYLEGKMISMKEHQRHMALQKLTANAVGDLEVSL
jgi:hypothetical protein